MIRRLTNFVFNNSVLLIAGAVGALVWANVDHESYKHALHLQVLANAYVGAPAAGGGKVIDLHFLVNDILMALFFAMAGREVWHAMLPGGALSSPRKAATPMICAVGGMIVPALIYMVGATCVGRVGELYRGWAVPTATDIAFSYMIARLVFGVGHPAVTFLLLLAIADDALGLIVLAVFYPQGPLLLWWLLMPVVAMAICVGFWRLRVRNFLWYLLIPGVLSWWGLAQAGLHPALGLLPIVPMLPQVHRRILPGWDFVSPADAEQFELWLKKPVEIILGLFGLFNAGVALAIPSADVATVAALVLGGLVIGKPIGVFLTALLATKVLGLQLASGLTMRDLLIAGCIAGIGFTVALFVATVAFGAGSVQDAAKLGALLSFLAAPVGLAAGRLMGVRKVAAGPDETKEVPLA